MKKKGEQTGTIKGTEIVSDKLFGGNHSFIVVDTKGREFTITSETVLEMMRYLNFSCIKKIKRTHLENPSFCTTSPKINKKQHDKIKSLLENYHMYIHHYKNTLEEKPYLETFEYYVFDKTFIKQINLK